MSSTEAPLLLRLNEVEQRTGMKRSSIYRRIETAGFPAAVFLGAGRRMWRTEEVDAWLAKLPVSSTPVPPSMQKGPPKKRGRPPRNGPKEAPASMLNLPREVLVFCDDLILSIENAIGVRLSRSAVQRLALDIGLRVLTEHGVLEARKQYPPLWAVALNGGGEVRSAHEEPAT